MENVNAEVPKEESIEGKIVRGRPLGKYSYYLRFDPNILANQNVLNFGSGGSDIGKELEKRKIPCTVIDVDLEITGTGQLFFPILKHMGNFINKDSLLGRKLTRMHSKFSKANERNFVQADGRALPFKDKVFDTVLALWSTYQIPEEDKRLA